MRGFLKNFLRRFKKSIVIFFAVIVLSFFLRGPLFKLFHAFLLRTDVGKSLVGVFLKTSFYQKHAQPRLLRKEYVYALYQTLKDVHEVLEVVGIPYWMNYGTLLGAVRHQGFIPWDDDCDLSIQDSYKNLFLSQCVPILKKLGYAVKTGEDFDGICIIPTHHLTLLPHERWAGCDVFFSSFSSRRWYNKGVGAPHYAIHLFPLKKYVFGPLMLWGADNPVPYLDAEYGKNWDEVAEMGLDHHTIPEQQGTKKIPFLLKTHDPALPFKPLEDHKDEIIHLWNSLD